MKVVFYAKGQVQKYVLYRFYYTLVRAGVLLVEKYTIDGIGICDDYCSFVSLEGLRKATEGLRIVGGPVGIGTWHLEQYASGSVLGRRAVSGSRLGTTRRVLTGGVLEAQRIGSSGNMSDLYTWRRFVSGLGPFLQCFSWVFPLSPCGLCVGHNASFDTRFNSFSIYHPFIHGCVV